MRWEQSSIIKQEWHFNNILITTDTIDRLYRVQKLNLLISSSKANMTVIRNEKEKKQESGIWKNYTKICKAIFRKYYNLFSFLDKLFCLIIRPFFHNWDLKSNANGLNGSVTEISGRQRYYKSKETFLFKSRIHEIIYWASSSTVRSAFLFKSRIHNIIYWASNITVSDQVEY